MQDVKSLTGVLLCILHAVQWSNKRENGKHYRAKRVLKTACKYELESVVVCVVQRQPCTNDSPWNEYVFLRARLDGLELGRRWNGWVE